MDFDLNPATSALFYCACTETTIFEFSLNANGLSSKFSVFWLFG